MAKKEKKSTETPNDQIQKFRSRIDEIDQHVLSLINERLSIGLQIGKLKEKKEDPVQDKSREAEILKNLTVMNKGPLKNEVLHHLFSEIISASRKIQEIKLISYLGPETTFSHIAARNFFGPSVSFVPQPNIGDIFVEVERNACHFGVVPVENSTEGTVHTTLDLFFESDLKICAEIYQIISYDLLSRSGILSEVREIYSHAQGFTQCRKWLKKHLSEGTLIECTSTAQAAKEAAGIPGSAAIASQEAARMYDLRVVTSKIEDDTRNTTRFIVIGKEAAQRTGKDKTSIMFVTAHVPGALFKILEPIAQAGINMLKLESRPTKYQNWNYCFFVDIEGHIEDKQISDTIKQMKSLCQYLKWIGSYPQSKQEEI